MSSNDKSTKETSSAKVNVAIPKAANKKTAAKTITVKASDITAETKKTTTEVKKATKTAKVETGLVVREKKIDPELALMASRAAAREKAGPEATRMKQNGRSVSGMVMPNRSRRQVNTAYSINVQREKVAAEQQEQKAAEAAESRFSKAKSALIGVGVALVVAVIGFAGIAIFGNNKKMCTVHFESNGGSEVAGTEIVCGRVVTEPSAPIKEGFSFEGWMLDGDLFDFTTGVYKNAILVARWKANEGTEIVTVKFDSDGGSKVNDVEVAKGKKLTRPNTPKRYGYAFDDWYLGDKMYDFDQPVSSDITLKAKWVLRPAVTENNGGQSGSDNKPSEKKYAESLEVGDTKVYAGENVSVTVTVLPSSAETRLIVSSSDESIATCNVTNTTITCAGYKPGTATVTVKDDLSGVKKSFQLVVEEKPSVELPVEPQPNPGEGDETDGSGDADDSGDTGGSTGDNGDSGETGGSGPTDGGIGDTGGTDDGTGNTGGTGGGAGPENQGDNPQSGQSGNSGAGV